MKKNDFFEKNSISQKMPWNSQKSDSSTPWLRLKAKWAEIWCQDRFLHYLKDQKRFFFFLRFFGAFLAKKLILNFPVFFFKWLWRHLKFDRTPPWWVPTRPQWRGGRVGTHKPRGWHNKKMKKNDFFEKNSFFQKNAIFQKKYFFSVFYLSNSRFMGTHATHSPLWSRGYP